jgi:hypothetical protein
MTGDLTPIVDNDWTVARRIAATAFVPDSYRNKPEEVFACLMYGRELGLGPMTALQQINVIRGKPSLAPESMRSRVFAAGHRIDTAEYGDDRVVLVGTRTNGATATVTWTLDDARRAGLANGESWRRYPRAMLLARATSELCRLLFPDVISGASYTPEELEAIGGDDGPSPTLSATATRHDDHGSSTAPASPAPGTLQPVASTDPASNEEAEGAEVADILEWSDIHRRASVLRDAGVDIVAERERAGLPRLIDLQQDDDPDPDALILWDRLLDRLERETEA